MILETTDSRKQFGNLMNIDVSNSRSGNGVRREESEMMRKRDIKRRAKLESDRYVHSYWKYSAN